ncbi:MAG: hypothetical protein DWQ04_27795, partial [Chloroflexi bacterium]
MRSQQRTASWDTAPTWIRLIGQNLPIVIFLILSAIGMITVYWFFSPVGSDADIIAASSGTALSAPIYKAV